MIDDQAVAPKFTKLHADFQNLLGVICPNPHNREGLFRFWLSEIMVTLCNIGSVSIINRPVR